MVWRHLEEEALQFIEAETSDLCDDLNLAGTLTYVILFHLQVHYLHFPESLVPKSLQALP